MTESFYLAGGYSGREAHARLARRIEEETGADCTSRWLSGHHEGDDQARFAMEDFLDVRRAGAIVLAHGPSTRGGKWVEMGLALAWNKPVILLAERRRGRLHGPRPPVFAWMKQVARYELCSDGKRPGDLQMSPEWPGRLDFLTGVTLAFHAHVMEPEA